MNILHHRRAGNIKTYLYDNGTHYCNCQEFADNDINYCSHCRQMNLDRIQAQADEVAIYKSEVLKENK